VFNCVVLTLTLVLGLLANLLVCWVVFRNKNLQTSNNALLVNLAASDLLKCAVDTPLFLVSFLSRLGGACHVSLCALQQFSYALCGCVQLLTLVSISVERFHAIAFPFQTERRRTRIRVWIPSIWICGVLLAVASLSLSKQALYYMLCRRDPCVGRGGEALAEQQQQPRRHTDPFGAYVLVPVWGVSLTLIVVYYARIFRVVRQHRQRVFDNGVQLRPATRQVWRWFSFAASEPATAPAPPPDPPPPHQRQRHHNLKLLPAMCWPASPVPSIRLITVAEAGSPSSPSPSPPPSPPLSARLVGNKRMMMRRTPPPEIAGAVCLLTPLARERGKKRMEGKLAQRFGYIIIAFTLFWVPMVVTLLMNLVSWQSTNSVSIPGFIPPPQPPHSPFPVLSNIHLEGLHSIQSSVPMDFNMLMIIHIVAYYVMLKLLTCFRIS